MKTFLIDDDSICNFISRQLLQEEYDQDEVLSFTCAEEALKVLAECLPSQVPDLIFLDLDMPLMSGWELLKHMEPYKEKFLGKCHIYILTSSLRLEDSARAREYALVCGLIHKPITSEDICMIRTEVGERGLAHRD